MTDAAAVVDVLSGFVAIAGATVLALAALALHRMPDIFGRLSATSKAVTLGATVMLAASALAIREPGTMARALAGIAFLLLTSPIAGHVLGRAAWRSGHPPVVTHMDDFPTGPAGPIQEPPLGSPNQATLVIERSDGAEDDEDF